MADYDSPLLADALVNHRDGIVGEWKTPSATPPQLQAKTKLEDVIRLWDPSVRAAIIDSEIFSRIGFEAPSDDRIDIKHLNAGSALAYQPLVSITRPGNTVFESQLKLVHNHADLRADRISEIVTQIGGAAAFIGSITFLRPERARWTMELLDAAFRLAQFVEMRAKHALACRRPIEFSAQIQPIILTPGHGTLPSGHATEAFTLAVVLRKLLIASMNPAYGSASPDLYDQQLIRQATRIAINRTVAGVHFPVDSVVGAVLGVTLGHYFVSSAVAAEKFQGWAFDGASYPKEMDFEKDKLLSGIQLTEASGPVSDQKFSKKVGSKKKAGELPTLNWLWRQACAEWT